VSRNPGALQGALWCARPASDNFSKTRVDSPAVRLAAGPYTTLASSPGVCALADDHVDCLWPTFPYSHQPRKPGERATPNTSDMTRLDGKYAQAVRTVASTCALGLDGRVTCLHASERPKTFAFSGAFTELAAQGGICAKRQDNTWQCDDNVAQPNQALTSIRVVKGNRVAGLTPTGNFVGWNVPAGLRGGFKAIYGDVAACAVRDDDTVFCERPPVRR